MWSPLLLSTEQKIRLRWIDGTGKATGKEFCKEA